MFREMRRFKQQISEEDCIGILKEQPRGVLSIVYALRKKNTNPVRGIRSETDSLTCKVVIYVLTI